MYKILISDAETRKAFDVVSIVIHAFPDIPVIAGDIEGKVGSQKHLKRLFHCIVERLRVSDKDAFVTDLDAIVSKYHDDQLVFLPMEEKSVAFFYDYLKKNGKKNLVFLLPSEEIFSTLRNKGELNVYCIKNALSAPVFYCIDELDNLTEDKFPILLKPCVGSGSEGQYRLYSPEDYTLEIKEVVKKKPYLAQELIGNGHDVKGAFFLYDENGFVDAYTHERIRTSPPTGGVTVLSKLTYDKELIEEGKMILDMIGWQGLIMLEFLYDEKTGKYKVIEANPRAWGSIMLSEFSGSNLLTNYVRKCIGVPVESDYKKGDCYIRWFFPVDILNYVKALGKIKGFWKFTDTCFINWSYASKWSAIKFNVHNLFQVKNLKRFLRK